MEKQFVWKNDYEINRLKDNVDYSLMEFRPFLERCNSLSVIPPLETESLSDFFLNPKTFFVLKLTKGETLNVGDLKLSSEKVYDLLDRPEGLDKLVSDIEALQKDRNFMGRHFGDLVKVEIKDGTLQYKQSWIDAITEQHSYYIETENQFTAQALANEIVLKINELMSICDTRNLRSKEDVSAPLEAIFKGSGHGKDRTYETDLASIISAF
ncbi:hypothetical protein [Epilithonimonas xixisoli]|uniref:Uncharacterized protein n=1 Tax=Epilithonimonas xixisoli TaxID=1476462 RepID=A0A4R8IEH0_9FLAO|nr:hypothetical protein [Epilithonimonas xixisoli]TDX84050.1 hypothetical protein B0I22_1644 [Epilithonimonas xixisoli]